MTFLPIVERELRVRARQRITHRFRVGSALAAMGLVVFMLFLGGGFSSGQRMFHTLAWLAFAFCLFEGARNTADSVSEEKRSGTLGLLFLTDLKGYDVVLGKFAASSLNSFYGLLAIFPPLALPILIGGVTGAEFWRLVLALVNTLFFSLCLGIFVSCFSREERNAWGTSAGALVLITAAPLLLQVIPKLPPSWLTLFSPAFGFNALFDDNFSANPEPYYNSLLLIHLFSWSMLIGASLLLPRLWQEGDVFAERTGIQLWVDRLMPARARIQRSADRARLINLNPVMWLAFKQHRSVRFLWLLNILAVLAGITSLVTKADSGSLFLAVAVLHIIVAFCVAETACNFFPEARSSGALELLLCTPFPLDAIVEGYRLALKRIFAPPLIALISIELLILAGHVFQKLDPLEATVMPPIAAVCLLILLMDLHAAGEYGMWQGLVSKKSTQALTKTMVYVILLPALSCCSWPFVAVVKNLVFINYARDQMRRRFRLVVSERFNTPQKPTDWLSPFARRDKHRLPRVLPD